MLKSLSNLIIFITSLVLISCAKPKAPEPTTPPGGNEGGALTTDVATKDIAFDSVGSDGGNISGLSTVNFDYDSSTLSSESRRLLSDNATWIKNNPKTTVQVEGHCDSRGSVEYNLALGERRAKAVKAYLVSLGVEAKRLTLISYGEEKPIATGESEDVYAKNRRANFVPISQ